MVMAAATPAREVLTPLFRVKAQAMANHESARTTKLYDRRDDKFSLDEVERIAI